MGEKVVWFCVQPTVMCIHRYCSSYNPLTLLWSTISPLMKTWIPHISYRLLNLANLTDTQCCHGFSWFFMRGSLLLNSTSSNLRYQDFFPEKFIMTGLSCIEVLRLEKSQHHSILNACQKEPKKHCSEKSVILRCGWSAPPTLQITVIWDPCRWVTIDDLVHCCAHLYLFTSMFYCLPRPVCLLFSSHVFSKAAFQHCASLCLSGKSLNSCPACMFACVYMRIFVWMCMWGVGVEAKQEQSARCFVLKRSVDFTFMVGLWLRDCG